MSQATALFLDGLRKQSFSVILTVAGLVGLGWWNLHREGKFEQQIEELRTEIKTCQSQKEMLLAEVSRLDERVKQIASAPVRKR